MMIYTGSENNKQTLKNIQCVVFGMKEVITLSCMHDMMLPAYRYEQLMHTPKHTMFFRLS